MTEPLIAIGIGAQKAATSWLHSALAHHPDCAMTRVKGLHYFNKFEPGRAERDRFLVARKRTSIARARSNGASMIAGVPLDDFAAEVEAWAALTEHTTIDTAAYLALLHLNRPPAKVVGEVTPAYATLPRDGLRTLYEMSDRVRLIFVMRDPIDRFWSAARMRGRKQSPGSEVDHAISVVTSALNGEMPAYDLRADYAMTLDNLSHIAPAAHVHLDFYEDLFDSGLDRLCGFLGIAPHAATAPAPVNAGHAADLPRDLGRALYQRLARQYDAVAEHMGRMPAAWQNAMEVYG
ncbi:sulfotransferase [uncultured Tateyamaria sp.]|uniref:sulfotransferase n=1 Tax=uncultured Tateyamaria sp. TaxID=455651 RepID=UPI00261C8EB4|nr:sulfotransferase [uncultured Tateyamaria sp.]